MSFFFARAEPSRRPDIKGSELYEALYKAGYGSEGTMVHYHPILSEVKAVGAKVKSILDIGCSHGGGVKALWDSGKIASGVDISSSAVDMARSRHGDHPEMCIKMLAACISNFSTLQGFQF
jgi:SAM-dependent methyltransferase